MEGCRRRCPGSPMDLRGQLHRQAGAAADAVDSAHAHVAARPQTALEPVLALRLVALLAAQRLRQGVAAAAVVIPEEPEAVQRTAPKPLGAAGGPNVIRYPPGPPR